jgi:hypothetical protein
MAPSPSKVLTDLLLLERLENTRTPPWSLRSKVHKLVHDERSHLSPHVWVFWGLPYQQIFDGIGQNLRFRRTMRSNTGIGRPMNVYDGSKYRLRDFLDLEDDGGIAFVHDAHRLLRGPGTETYFKGFLDLWKSRFPTKQIVFLSEGEFFRRFDGMEHVKVSNGIVDEGPWPGGLHEDEEVPGL